MERAVIIGSGNLAEALARAVAKSGLKLVQIFAATPHAGSRSPHSPARSGRPTRRGWPEPTFT